LVGSERSELDKAGLNVNSIRDAPLSEDRVYVRLKTLNGK